MITWPSLSSPYSTGNMSLQLGIQAPRTQKLLNLILCCTSGESLIEVGMHPHHVQNIAGTKATVGIMEHRGFMISGFLSQDLTRSAELFLRTTISQIFISSIYPVISNRESAWTPHPCLLPNPAAWVLYPVPKSSLAASAYYTTSYQPIDFYQDRRYMSPHIHVSMPNLTSPTS